LHALRGEREQAAAEWLRALALDPGHAGAAVALARSYADGGEPERALKLLDNFNANLARRKAPAPPEVELARREIINTHNLPPDARGGQLVADERNVSATHDARPADRLAAAPTREENARAATNNSVATERPAALTLGQQTYDLLQRARAARGAGRHEESVGLYRRTLARHGGYLAPANLELGYALANLQRPDEAIAALAQVAARDGARYPVVFYHLGRLYESTNRLPSAAAAFARAAQLSGERNPQAFLDLSRVREKEGDNAAALAAMEDYARALSRAGSLPEWAATRLAQLRQKAAPATKQ
ncbi:MAG TPA: tetratricopeptide repeat protein, partial [Pyrinomonadaceae bacterium]|nr:tetratricopeptide repeat protein [Pyrinomonadaceae bacterium]